jgi:hypothetical protein
MEDSGLFVNTMITCSLPPVGSDVSEGEGRVPTQGLDQTLLSKVSTDLQSLQAWKSGEREQ